MRDRPANRFFSTAPARHPAGGATRAAERPSRRSRAPPTTLAPRGGRRRRAAPADGGRQRAAGAFCAEPPQSEAAFILFALARRLSQGREGAYKDIYPESWLLEHFLNTPSVPGSIHVLQEDDVWVINRDNRGASEMLASRSRACAVLRATRPPWGRAGPSAPARLSALV